MRRLNDPRWDTVHTVVPLFNWERSRLIHSAAMNSIQALHLTRRHDSFLRLHSSLMPPGRCSCVVRWRRYRAVGTRTRGFIDYRRSDEVDRSPDAILRILEPTTLACRAVEEYCAKRTPTMSLSGFSLGLFLRKAKVIS